MSDRLLRKLFVVAALVSACAAVQASDVRARLSLRDGKTTFVAGDPIVLDLELESLDGPAAIDRTTAESEMSIDQVEIVPAAGIYPWRADSERFSPRWGDTFVRYPASTRFATALTLDRRDRFDAAGTYTVTVVSSRVRPAATSNPVTFTVSEASIDEQKVRATELDRAIRSAKDSRTAAAIANRIDWLADDAATEVKLALLVGPEKSDCYFRHDRVGLWIARDRARVVRRLEQAVVDPDEDIPMGSSLIGVLISLKISLEHPLETDANTPLAARRGNVVVPGPYDAESRELMAGYAHAIAQTLPMRHGKSLIDAAQRVMRAKDRSKPMDDPDFVAAREVLIDHFEDVDEYNIDSNLNAFGTLLEDPRMIPKLHRMLDRPAFRTALFASTRGQVLQLLARIEPASLPTELTREACDEHPASLMSVRDIPIETLPQADECLREKLVAQSVPGASRTRSIELNGVTLPYVARFASPALVPDVERLYPSLVADPDRRAAAAALAYLMRWNPERDRPLLDAAVDDRRDLSLFYNIVSAAPPRSNALRAFLRERIALPPDAETTRYVSALGQIGDADDDDFFRDRLAVLQAQDGASPDKIGVEKAIEQALRCNGWRRSGQRC